MGSLCGSLLEALLCLNLHCPPHVASVHEEGLEVVSSMGGNPLEAQPNMNLVPHTSSFSLKNG